MMGSGLHPELILLLNRTGIIFFYHLSFSERTYVVCFFKQYIKIDGHSFHTKAYQMKSYFVTSMA